MTENKNPFLKPYNTPHDTAPFHLIKIEHYEPALLEGMKEQNEEIDAIVNNPEAPTFQNTIVALENSGALLDRVTTVFGNLMSAETSDEMQELAEKMMPLLSEHSNNISLNEKLFARIKAVYEQKDQLQLKGEDAQLLQKTYDSFVRSGANLTGEAKEKFRQLNTELSILTLRFSQNLLKETNNYELALTEKQLEGLPESSLESYAQTAKDKGKEGSIITLDAPSFVPFMKYCDDRSLRREVYMAYNTQCTHNNDYNNVDIIKQLVNIRMELAHLLGFSTFAEYKLKKRMAETSDAVYKLLNQLLEAYTPAALKEVAEVEALAREMEGNDFQLMPWDWAYYSEKLKNKKFNLNEEELRPYFELSQVEKGVFGLATRLYGITFKENKEIPVYHPDVKAYEVFDKDGSFLAVLYTDFHPRAGKRSGAWMTSYKEQWIEYGTVQRAVLGIKGTPINDDQQMMPEEIKKKVKELGATDGVLIAEVIDGGSAAGNLEVDDVIIGIDGKRVKNFAELQEGLAKHRPGDKVTVKVLRDKKEKDIEMTLKNAQGTTKVVKSAGMDILGAAFREVPQELKRQLNLGYGVEVTGVTDGKMKAAGIRKGFIILKANGQPVKSVNDLEDVLKAATQSPDQVLFLSGMFPSGKRANYAVDLIQE